MATLVLGAVGAAVGGSLGGSFLGLSAAVIGRAAGATLGRVIDQSVLGSGSDAIEHGRVDRIRVVGASEGAAIPRVVGRVRVPGQVIWATRFKETRETSGGGGGKGAPKPPKTTTYSYSVSCAMALCEGQIARVGRIWADGVEIARNSLQMRVYDGADDQQPDALMEALDGAGNVPAYRGTAYVVIEDMDLTPFGNRIPNLSFEVVRFANAPGEIASPAELIEGVCIVPGTGEYSLSTTAVHYNQGGGTRDSANVNTEQAVADFKVSMDDLVEELPNIKTGLLVVSWFGDDLRCGSCTIRPMVEQKKAEGDPQPWRVSGLTRSTALAVPERDGRPIYGGTPSDTSVVEAIRDLRERGLDVTFYPFILMTPNTGNGLPDPYGGDEQAALPWRGRITTSVAPMRDGSVDRTSAAEDEVAAFFGTTSGADFWQGGSGPEPTISGPANDWSYRRFILHYAKLCAAAGGVEAFCIGSEMRGITQIRGNEDRFPSVDQMVSLAAEVRAILPSAKISYAADWSEYFGYTPEDTGNLHYHLDPLWASEDIDFIAIDNYMPLADWRDGEEHADFEAESEHRIEYLQSNIEGGEGFDWFYSTSEAREAQRRTDITDGEGSPWVWRFKDIRSWWSNLHYNRIDGVVANIPTGWEPGLKPIRFTEYGCAAIDKGANQPNKFLDPKSSESALPYFSNGRRDDTAQMQYHRALLSYWKQDDRNPVSTVYGGQMLDLAHSAAWAWDARPWPAFPGLDQFWTDAPNYDRGHWLSGRAASQPLANVIAEICDAVGIARYDVRKVHGVVRGYSVSSVQSARADLQPLLMANGVDVTERDGTLVFFMRAEATLHEVPADRLVRTEQPLVQTERGASAEVPARVVVHHIDANGDFEARVGVATQPGTKSLPVAESELPLALTRGEAHGLAERFLAEARVSRDGVEMTLPPSMRQIGSGDYLRLKGQDETWRIDRLEDMGARGVSATRTERAVFEASDAVEDGSGRVRPLAPLPVDALIMDLPQLRSDDVPHAPYIAVSARPWPGSVTVYSSPEDAGYRVNSEFREPAMVGTTETELLASQPGIWDYGPELLVRLPAGALSSVSSTALFAGGNAAAIGTEGADWEVFQFRDARLVGSGLWALSKRLRGQKGTVPAIADVRPVGSRVVILNEGIGQLDLPLEAVGLERHLRIGPSRLSNDHESFRYSKIVPVGAGLRPFPPVHVLVRREGQNVEVSWIRQSRIATADWGAVDVPLGEAREQYLVTVTDAEGTIRLERIVSEPKTAFNRTIIGDQQDAPFKVSVAQVSELVGPGVASSITVS